MKSLSFLLRLIIVTLLLGLGLAGLLRQAGGRAALAQAAPPAQEETEEWALPVNLSESGAVGPPQVLALEDQFLVFWRDELDGFTFTQGEDTRWDQPVTAEFPFATRIYATDLQPESPTPLYEPELVYGAGLIHAFWHAEEGQLFYSQVPAEQFGTFDAWSTREQLADDALGATALAVGEDVHLLYINRANTPEQPAGLYYRRSTDSGQSWQPAVSLYDSVYLRLLEAGEVHVQLVAAPGGQQLYAAWDAPSSGRVLLARSTNGGQTWVQAEVIDSRLETDGATSGRPARISVAALQGGEVHLTWQSGFGSSPCVQMHQWSADGGSNWQQAQPILDDLNSCADNVTLLVEEGQLLLLAQTPSGTFLSLWNEGRWSGLLRQEQLARFVDPDSFWDVQLDCGLAPLAAHGRLVVAACGQGAERDVWWLTRPLAPLVAQVQQPSVWNTPAPVAPAAAEEAEALAIAAPVMVADAQGRFHAFWMQRQTARATAFAPGGSTGASSIIYARRDGDNWSRPVEIPGTAGVGLVDPAVVIGRDGRLLLLWSSEGVLYASWAVTDRATVASEWAERRTLSAPGSAQAPTVVRDPLSGQIIAAYAVELNEQRGIYLVRSDNGGENWSEPSLVVDAAARGWDRVALPQLARDVDGRLHLLFQQTRLPGEGDISLLYYTRSEDGGNSWTEPLLVSNGTQQTGYVIWSGLATAGDRVVHRAWQEWDGQQRALWHQVSLDRGLTWSRAGRVGGLGTAGGPVVLMQDVAQQLYVVQMEAASIGLRVQPWLWLPEEERWVEAESLRLGDEAAGGQVALAGAISPPGQLAVLVMGEGAAGPLVLSSSRPVTLPEQLPTPLPTLTPTPIPTATPTATPQPAPTATPVFSTVADNSPQLTILPSLGANMLAFTGLGALLGGALIVLVGWLVYLQMSRKRR